MRSFVRFIPIVFVVVLVFIGAAPVFAQSDSVDLTGESGVKEVEVRSRGLNFMPTEIRVNVGDTVRVTFVNGGGRHDWVLDEFDAATNVISAGQSETIEFVADEAGTFEFYCSVPGHRQAGMVGSFVVVN